MTKTQFLYEDMTRNTIPEIITLQKIAELVGIPYRTLQRKMAGKNKYYDSDGNFRISRVNKNQDGRKRNTNPNLKSR